MDLKSAALVFAVSCLFAAVLTQSRGLPWYVTVIICAGLGIVLFGSILLEKRDNRKSLGEAEKFRAGYAFKDPGEEQKYSVWCEKHPPSYPEQDMLRDLIGRYRAPRLIAELLGVLALGLTEIILFREKAEGRGEPAVIYIVLGLMILLLYFAASNIFGIRARRFYGRISGRPDFLRIRRSYSEGTVIGHHISYINIGSEYITLVTRKAVIPVNRSEIGRVCRANVLTAYYTNSAYTGSKESYFIKLYAGAEYRVQLRKFEMIQAYELLKRAGLPADDTIEMR